MQQASSATETWGVPASQATRMECSYVNRPFTRPDRPVGGVIGRGVMAPVRPNPKHGEQRGWALGGTRRRDPDQPPFTPPPPGNQSRPTDLNSFSKRDGKVLYVGAVEDMSSSLLVLLLSPWPCGVGETFRSERRSWGPRP